MAQPTKPKYDPEKELAWLTQVDQQIATASEVDKSARMKSVQWANRAEALRTLDSERNGDSRLPSSAELLRTAKVLEEVAAALNPVGAFSWKQEDVVACAERIRSFLTLGMLDDTVVEEANRLVGQYSTTTKARGSAKVFDDRPAKVIVTTTDGTVITEQVGNTDNSPGNVRNTIIAWLKNNNIVITDEQKTELGKQVRTCLVEKIPVVKLGDFATISHKN